MLSDLPFIIIPLLLKVSKCSAARKCLKIHAIHGTSQQQVEYHTCVICVWYMCHTHYTENCGHARTYLDKCVHLL